MDAGRRRPGRLLESQTFRPAKVVTADAKNLGKFARRRRHIGASGRATMGREDVLISNNEREFIVKALRESELRVDGRGPFDLRPVSYRFGPKDGTCEVTLGKTRVLAVVSAELEPPAGGRGNEGRVTINVEFSPMASPNFEPGRPGEEASELAVVLERAIRETGAVDVESLCVLAGRRVWHVRCDVHVIDACGNIVGAASLAANAALLSFRRPEATVAPDTQRVTVHPADVREPIPLALHHLPVAFTFGFFAEHDGLVIVDPTVKEEAVMGSELVVVLNAHNELCAVQKGGGSAVNPSEVMRCLRVASQMTKDATDALKRAHAAWEEERDKRRVRRHYGAEAAANPDFGLPGRGDHRRPAAELAAEADDLEGDEEEEEEEGKSDSDDDFRGEGAEEEPEPMEADDGEGADDEEGDAHVPVGVMAPPDDDDEDEDEDEEDAEAAAAAAAKSATPPGKKGKRVASAAADDDDDFLGMFDEAAKRSGAGKKKKKRAGWDDLPGDGDDLAAAIKAKVDKKSKRKAARGKK